MPLPTTDEMEHLVKGIHEVSLLKQGGQKAVYQARHDNFGSVVVKVVLDTCADARIRREIEIVAGGTFPHVPRIYDWGEGEHDNGPTLYVIEQFVAGGDLRRILNTNGRLGLIDVARLLSDLLETAAALEIEGVVHRDIKPENIIAGEDGHFWLLDFGIARDLRRTSLTATGAHFGPHTAGYAAPEQFRNMKKRIDSRCDLFSIGVVAYEMLAGKHPFASEARDYLDVLRRTETLAMVPFQIEGDPSGHVSQFLYIMMERFPSRRPPSVAMAREWFSEIVSGLR